VAWLDAFKGKLIGVDTSPMIYYLEEHPDYVGLLDPLFDMLDSGNCSIITSVVTLLEGLVIPIRANDNGLIRKWYDFLYNTDNITTVDVSPAIAKMAAQLRAVHEKLKTPDAVQISTAIVGGASVFLTNDSQLASISDIEVVLLDKLKTDS
jgi:predicted nucleic acid-binding protein